MKALIQRVTHAELSVNGALVSSVQRGYLVFLGVQKGDTREQAEYLAAKTAKDLHVQAYPPRAKLRIFEDENGKINRSVLEVGGEALAVSQFTLLANASHGNRPDFLEAEVPALAEPLYDCYCESLRACGVPVKKGIFGADMKIELLNDGPFTILLEK